MKFLKISCINNILEHSVIPRDNEEYRSWLNVPKTHYLTLLQYAVLENMPEEVERLLEYGANPNNLGSMNVVTNMDKCSSVFPMDNLSIAIKNKNPEIVSLLLKYGAKVR